MNPRRGAGTSVNARLELLQGVLGPAVQDGPCVYFTSAGFFGCAPPAGDRIRHIRWPGRLELSELNRRLGALTAALPFDQVLGVGVEQSPEYTDQRIWWYRGGSRVRHRETVRAESPMPDRRIEVGGFRVLAFVCGELCDGGSGFDAPTDTAGIDVVLDAAHASVARAWDRAAIVQRFAFHRAFGTLSRYCGGMLTQAHDAGEDYARRQDNWVVYRGELPFPDVEVVAI